MLCAWCFRCFQYSTPNYNRRNAFYLCNRFFGVATSYSRTVFASFRKYSKEFAKWNHHQLIPNCSDLFAQCSGCAIRYLNSPKSPNQYWIFSKSYSNELANARNELPAVSFFPKSAGQKYTNFLSTIAKEYLKTKSLLHTTTMIHTTMSIEIHAISYCQVC